MQKKILSVDPSIYKDQFINDDPFHHVVIDNFLEENFAKELRKNFPNPHQENWWVYNNPLEKKFAFNNIESLNDCFNTFFSYVNSEEFIKKLEELTGVSNLKPDKQLNGGGLHMIARGGKLDIHEDYNIHKGLGMLRKLNLIYYLSDPWDESWGGHLELWNKDMTKCHKKIAPIFNRAVIFRTDMGSNHGHPHPLTCPEKSYRMSLATYYYVVVDNLEKIPFISTFFKKLPDSNDQLDELREIRKNGRLKDLKTKG